MTDYKALCTEILKLLDNYEDGLRVDWDDWRDRARAALAQPEPVGPTDEELLETAADAVGYEHVPTDEDCLSLARAVLARYGRPAVTPIPVSERLPGPEDCDAHGWCWVLYGPYATWTLEPPLDGNRQPCGWTHWLPFPK